MSVDLMEMLKGAVSKQVMGKLGGMLGMEEKKTSSIFETAAGTILGGLIKKSGTKEGAKVVFESAQKQDGGILDKLGDLLDGGDNTRQLEESGGGILDTVFGDSQGGILESIAKALGLDGNVVGKLLKLAAPMILAVIGRHIKSKALDAVGLGSLLGDQKQHLGKYIPAGLAGSLGLSNLVGDAGKAVSGAADSARDMGRAATGADAEAGGGLAKLLLPLLGLLLLAGLGWYFFGRGGDAGGPTPRQVDGGAIPSEAKLDAPGLGGLQGLGDLQGLGGLQGLGDAGKTLQEGFGKITTGLTNLKDEAGANDLVTNIGQFSEKVDGLGIAKLTGPAKAASSTMIGKFVETVKGLVDKIDNEAIKSIVKPAIDGLVEKLSAFTS